MSGGSSEGLDPVARYEIETAARKQCEADALAAARPRLFGPPRGAVIEVVLREQGQLLTVLGYPAYGRSIHGITRLDPYLVEIGNLYGGMVEALQGSDLRGVDLMSSGGGSSGPEGAVDRRLRYRALVDAADRTLQACPALRPGHAGRKPQGDAKLGKVHKAKPTSGTVKPVRLPIRALTVVQSVCVGDRTLGQVLKAHGWAAKGRSQARLVEYLADVLGEVAGAMGEVEPVEIGRGFGSECEDPSCVRWVDGAPVAPMRKVHNAPGGEVVVGEDGVLIERSRPRAPERRAERR